MMQNFLLITTLSVGSLLFASSAHLSHAADAGQAPRLVKTLIVSAAKDSQSRRFFGQVRARETVDLSFEVPGYLARLDAIEGVHVTKGQELAVLDLAPFTRAISRAELALEKANRDLERARNLAKTNVGTRVRALDAETERDLAEVALREARDNFSDAVIEAPFDGIIATRIATAFSTIEPGQPIVRVHDMSEVRVEFELPERVLQLIGDPARVLYEGKFPNYPDPIMLRFAEYRTETEQLGQSYTVSLAIPSPERLGLLPGASVMIEASVPTGDAGIELPPSTIVTDPERRSAVFALRDDGSGGSVLEKIAVSVRSENGRGLLIDGIEPGTEIVLVGGHMLREGQSVKRYTGLTVEEP